jgi:hypothetical protein
VSKLPRYLGVAKCGFTNIPMKKRKKEEGEKKKNNIDHSRIDSFSHLR